MDRYLDRVHFEKDLIFHGHYFRFSMIVSSQNEQVALTNIFRRGSLIRKKFGRADFEIDQSFAVVNLRIAFVE